MYPKPKSNQDSFNHVWDWFFVKENNIAIVNGVCVYRGGKKRCAIGCQLPDKLYNSKFEGQNIYNLYVRTDVEKVLKWFENCDKDFLRDLQYEHDNSTNKHKLKEGLEQVAFAWDLKVPTNV